MKKDSGEKNTFLLYKDWKPLIDACTAEQAGDVLKGIYAYVCEGEAPEFDNPLLSGFFEMIRQAIDSNDKVWAEKREKARKAIQARWEKKQAEVAEDQQEKPERDGEAAETIPDKPDHTGESTEKAGQEHGQSADKERTEPDKTGLERTKPDKPKEKQAPLPPKVSARTIFNACLMAYPISNDLQAAMETWLKYKTERRESYKEQGLRALMKKASQSEQEYGTSAVIDLIEASMSSGYQGITWDRLRGRSSPAKNTPVKKNQFTQFEMQQDYDIDAIEKDLLTST